METLESLGRIIGFDQQMLIQLGQQWFNTMVVVFFLAFILYNPVRNFMKSRTERIKVQLEIAENDKKSAADLKLQYEAKLKDIEAERSALLDEARKRAYEKGEQIIAEAKNEAEIIRKRTTLNIQREQEKAQADMKAEIVEISTLLAKRYVSLSMDNETASKLIDDAIADLGDIKWHN